MKKCTILFACFVIISYQSNAQFKSQVREQQSAVTAITRPSSSGLLFGWFDQSKLFMRQSYTLSYSTFGNGQGYSLGVYTNSLLYKISDPLSLQFDVSLIHSPYSSPALDGYTRALTGIHLTRAQLNYQPSETVLFQIQYRQIPGYWFNSMTPFDGLAPFPSFHTKEEEH